MNCGIWNGNEASAEISTELTADDLNMTDGDDKRAVTCMPPATQSRPIDCRPIIGRSGNETIADVVPGSSEDNDYSEIPDGLGEKSSVRTTIGN